ncbi:hypothetical protein SNE40_022242 [Patella caerulea]|uniref:Uncharacterized protein n=1 Tax=Patella caerulea TaxID=87958 RepID=A0AAN8G7N6_PATCE
MGWREAGTNGWGGGRQEQMDGVEGGRNRWMGWREAGTDGQVEGGRNRWEGGRNRWAGWWVQEQMNWRREAGADEWGGGRQEQMDGWREAGTDGWGGGRQEQMDRWREAGTNGWGGGRQDSILIDIRGGGGGEDFMLVEGIQLAIRSFSDMSKEYDSKNKMTNQF